MRLFLKREPGWEKTSALVTSFNREGEIERCLKSIR